MQTPPQSAAACIKCGAPVGHSGGRCPFCGTEQPNDPSNVNAATVGLTDVNRARMSRRPPTPSVRKREAPLGWIFLGVAVLGVAIGVGLWRMRPPPPQPIAKSVPTVIPEPPGPERDVAGVHLSNAKRVEPTDYLPKVRKAIASWDASPELLEITVQNAKSGYVDLEEPGAEVVYRFISAKRDPAAKDPKVERMAVVLKLSGGGQEKTSAAVEKGVHDPTCVFSAAFHAATASGMKAPFSVRYGLLPKSTDVHWVFTSGGEQRVIDGQTCSIKR